MESLGANKKAIIRVGKAVALLARITKSFDEAVGVSQPRSKHARKRGPENCGGATIYLLKIRHLQLFDIHKTILQNNKQNYGKANPTWENVQAELLRGSL
jgi:hypothetical protein